MASLFNDDFNGPAGSSPDLTKWTLRLNGLSAAGQLQACTADLANTHLDGNGNLELVALKTPQGEYTSAYLQSKETFKYGNFVARIKTPTGQGIWPAFWMVGLDGAWPACGEIDIMEQVGNKSGVTEAHIHGTNFEGTLIGQKYSLPSGEAFSEAFHDYQVVWRPGTVSFAVDGVTYASYSNADMKPGMVWPFDDQPMCIRLSLAVGGEWPGRPNAETVFPSIMKVNSVNVYSV